MIMISALNRKGKEPLEVLSRRRTQLVITMATEVLGDCKEAKGEAGSADGGLVVDTSRREIREGQASVVSG